jgi:3-dehydroquinate synthetase
MGSVAQHVVGVTTGSRSYNVFVEDAISSRLGQIVREVLGPKPRRAVIIADTHLPMPLLAGVEVSLFRAGFQFDRMGIEATEANKTVRTLERVLEFLASRMHERGEPVIALGGGIVGDLAGFAAAVHRRGCPVIQCPTTLLAMVDASVGGKTGVNLEVETAGGSTLLKNAVGAFHQPHAVVIGLDTLDSLPARQFNAGLAECVKHALLGGAFGDGELMEWMEEKAKQRSGETTKQGEAPCKRGAWRASVGEASVLRELVLRSVLIKAKVVAGDEREEATSATGGRALLNLGHTFAHAIETLPGLTFRTCEGEKAGALLHGEAVGLGLLAACRVAAEMSRCEEGLSGRVAALLQAFELPVAVSGLPSAEDIVARMQHDKKVLDSVLRLVLPTAGCRAEVVENPARELVVGAVESLRDKGR